MSSISPDDVASLATKYDTFLTSLTAAETAAFTRVIHATVVDEQAAGDVEGFALSAPTFNTVFGGIPGNPIAPGGDAAGVSALLHACCTGTHFKKATLTVRNSG